MAIRIALRKPAVLDALGISDTTFYDGIAKGFYPKGTPINPEGRAVVWWEDEIEAIQKQAVVRAAASPKRRAGPFRRKPLERAASEAS